MKREKKNKETKKNKTQMMYRKWAERERRARKKWRRCTHRKRRIIEGALS